MNGQIITLLFVLLMVPFIPLSFAEVGDFVGELVPPAGHGFSQPFGVEIDNNGRIIVSDLGSDSIKVFDESGIFLFEFDGSDNGGTRFDSLTGVAVDRTNNIIVADVGLDKVQVFNPDGNFMHDLSTTNSSIDILTNPIELVVASSGRIIVTVDTPGMPAVQVFSPMGEFLFEFDGSANGGTQFRQPYGVTVDGSDNILVVDTTQNNVQVFSPMGEFLFEFDGSANGGTQFRQPYGVTVDRDRILVTDSTLNNIQIYSLSGEYIESFNGLDKGGTEFDYPTGIAVDGDGRIIVLDAVLASVQVFGGIPIEETTSDSVSTASSNLLDDPNGACGDCTPPTLGINQFHHRVVDNGFSYNGYSVQVERWHTPYPLITAIVGNLNLIQITAYENSGTAYMKMVQFGIGAKEIGESLNDIEVLIEVYLEVLDNDKLGVEKVIIKDRDNLIDTYATIAFVDIVKCMDDSQTKQCVQVILYYSYREPTINNVMTVSVSDVARNTQNFYFNDGVQVVGESLNEAPTYIMPNKHSSQQTEDLTLTLTQIDKVNHIWVDKYDVEYLKVSENRFDRITPLAPTECNDPPLSEINVPTRLNCNFRAQLPLWD